MNVKVMGLVVAGGIAAACAQLDAAEFARYSFTGSKASGGGSAGQVDAATAFGTGGTLALLNVVSQTRTDEFGASGYPTTGTLGAPTVSDALTFTFTPSQTVSYTFLRFDERQGTSGSTGGPRGLTVRSSATGTTNLLNTQATENTDTRHHDVDISSIASSNAAVTFSIYGWDSDSASNVAAQLILDNIVLEGTGVIPEPASIGLAALGATALIRRRRA